MLVLVLVFMLMLMLMLGNNYCEQKGTFLLEIGVITMQHII